MNHLDGIVTDGLHRQQVRVYYEDTDFSGVVYHASYLRFMERGRTNYLRLLGADHRAMFEQAEKEAPGFAFVVRQMKIDFRKPAHMDDVLDILDVAGRGQGRVDHAASEGDARRRTLGRGACPGRLRLGRPGQADPEAVADRDEGRPGNGRRGLTASARVASCRTKASHCSKRRSALARVAWNARGLIGVQLPEANEAATKARMQRRFPAANELKPPPPVQDAINGVMALLRGERRDLTDVVIDNAGVPDFNAKVYAVVRQIPPGQTLTYGEVAEKLGDKSLARAVGQAMGQNPCPIVMPCHRVLAASGKSGGFSAPGGVVTKLTLLTIEGAQPGGPTLFGVLPLEAAPRRS